MNPNERHGRTFAPEQYHLIASNIDAIIAKGSPSSIERQTGLHNLVRAIGLKVQAFDTRFIEAVRSGQSRDEASARREASKLLISTSILLARADFRPADQYLPGVGVTVFQYPRSDIKYHPLSANRIDISVPNPEPSVTDKLVLTSQLLNLVPHFRIGMSDPEADSYTVAEKILVQGKAEEVVESEDEFIMRRSYEIARIGSLQVTEAGVFMKLKQELCLELVNLWTERKSRGHVPAEGVNVSVGEFTDPINKGYLEIKVTSRNGRIVKFKMPRVERLRPDQAVLKAIKGIRRLGGRFDYIAQDQQRA